MAVSRTFIALAVGFWALAGQFIVNRVVFFYIANSEYAAASIIALHLAGFWLGATLARRHSTSVALLLAISFGVTFLAETLTWRLGALVLGLPATVAASAIFGLTLAALSGALILQLMQHTDPLQGQRILVADSAGSVAGALIGGFWLLPVLGIHASYVVILTVQALVLLATLRPWRHPKTLVAVVPVFVVLGSSLAFPTATALTSHVIAIEGMPVEVRGDQTDTLLFSERSPYGLLSVIQAADRRQLNIDGRPLCITWNNERTLDTSEWFVGEWPTQRAGRGENARLANIGLGCGMTMAALLDVALPTAQVDVIEINPVMPAAQRLFDDALPHGQNDPRVTMVLRDGFRHFADYQGHLYDVVALDVAWMQNMNATHLFSVEMYRNIRRSLKADGVLGVWSEEINPFSPVSMILYRTLREVFPDVVVDVSHDVVLYFASPSQRNLANDLDDTSLRVTDWLADVAAQAPVNRLDDLVMNRTKFTGWGDSTWERLHEKYAAMRETAWDRDNTNSVEEADDDITIP